MTYTVEGTISVQPAFSQSAQNMSNVTSSIANVTQSILQNSTEGSKIASGYPTIEVEQPVCPQGPLTGYWKANDGERYYVRQCGNTVWWAGMSDDGSGSVFTNVYKGNVSPSAQGLVGKNIIGQWCDVPRGTVMSCGTLVLHINSLTSLDKVSFTGGFGASFWQSMK